MFITGKETEESFDQYFLEELRFFDEADDTVIADWKLDLGDEIFSELQKIINIEDAESLTLPADPLDEQWTTISSAERHYHQHCMGNLARRSIRTNVFYDFTTFKEYMDYEQQISGKTQAADRIVIDNLQDGALVTQAFASLLTGDGDKTLVFNLGCGFHNSKGGVRLCIHAYSSSVTKNYSIPTVDFLVQAPNYRTISLYPISKDYLQSKINNKIAEIPNPLKLSIDNL